MKPTKKKNCQDVNQINKGGNKSAKQIDNYFKSAPKPFIVEKIDDSETTKAVYVEALQKKLDRKNFSFIFCAFSIKPPRKNVL